jgi:hypothetical protein
MQTTTPKLTFKIPYAMRHLQPEVRNRGGRFNPDDKTWTLDDNEGNSALVAQLTSPPPRPAAPAEVRVRAVAQSAAELLCSLRIGTFVLIESSPTRVIIEKVPTA